MSPREQARQERLFLEASRLKGKERRQFLDEACRDQPELRQTVETLLAQVGHSGAHARPTAFRHESEGLSRTVRRRGLMWAERWVHVIRWPAGPLLALVFLVITGLWSYDAMREGLEQVVEEALVSNLEDDKVALERAFDAKRSTFDYFVSEPNLRAEARQLIDEAGELPGTEDLLGSPRLARIRGVLDPLKHMLDIQGFWLVDRSGRILAADIDQDVGVQISVEGLGILQPAFSGENLRWGPVAENRLLRDGHKDALFPVMLWSGPLIERGDGPEAVLVLLFDSQQFFARMLRTPMRRKGWDSFAFDESGTLLSETTYLSACKELGLVPDVPDASSALRIQLRDPGGDLTEGFENATPPASWPLTHMAASALSGEAGVELEGYRNFLGQEVYGAWVWVPEHRMGLAVEIRTRKAKQLVRPVRLAFGGLFALVVFITLTVGALTFVMKVMHQRLQADQLGQYTLLEKIGEGGMGIVYRARHAMLRRETAVKILSADVVDAESLVRFEREVQITSQLTHPNTIEVYDYGHDERTGLFYYAMEFVDGLTLADLLEIEGAQPVGRVVHILKQVCGSLAEAHDAGLIHRDIKPLNIMLCQRGGASDVVKVLDFGLVADVKPERVGLTSPDVIKGTPLYIAPERLLAPETVDARSDIYSLGTVAYNLLTGKEVFEGTSSAELLDKVLRATPKPPSEVLGRPVAPEVERLVLACLEKAPERRPASVSAILGTLETLSSVPRWTAEEADERWEGYREEQGQVETPAEAANGP